MKEQTAQKTKKVLGIIGNVVLWIIVAFSILTTIFVMVAQNDKDGVPQIFGKSIVTIQTDSMDPTYKVGDLVFIDRLSDEEKRSLQRGDIITFHSPVDINGDGQTGDINTHRIDKIEGEFIYTRGDKEGAPLDVSIGYGDIIGKCTEDGKIGGLGGILDFLRSSLGFFLCVVLPMLLFFLYELYNFISLLTQRRMEKAPVSQEAEEEIKRRAIEEYLAQQAAATTPASVEEGALPDPSNEEIKEENTEA